MAVRGMAFRSLTANTFMSDAAVSGISERMVVRSEEHPVQEMVVAGIA